MPACMSNEETFIASKPKSFPLHPQGKLLCGCLKSYPYSDVHMKHMLYMLTNSIIVIHTNLTVENAGLRLSMEHPYIGA